MYKGVSNKMKGKGDDGTTVNARIRLTRHRRDDVGVYYSVCRIACRFTSFGFGIQGLLSRYYILCILTYIYCINLYKNGENTFIGFNDRIVQYLFIDHSYFSFLCPQFLLFQFFLLFLFLSTVLNMLLNQHIRKHFLTILTRYQIQCPLILFIL